MPPATATQDSPSPRGPGPGRLSSQNPPSAHQGRLGRRRGPHSPAHMQGPHRSPHRRPSGGGQPPPALSPPPETQAAVGTVTDQKQARATQPLPLATHVAAPPPTLEQRPAPRRPLRTHTRPCSRPGIPALPEGLRPASVRAGSCHGTRKVPPRTPQAHQPPTPPRNSPAPAARTAGKNTRSSINKGPRSATRKRVRGCPWRTRDTLPQSSSVCPKLKSSGQQS